MFKREELTGIILAGGEGKRLHTEKGLCLLHDKPLVQYALETLEPLCGTVLISANRNLESYKKFGCPVVSDEVENSGPLGGILSCLKRSETRHNLVLSCDTPFVGTGLFKFLLQNIENYQVVAPSHETFLVEPLAAYYAVNVINEMEKAVYTGDLKMTSFLKRIRFKSLPVDKNFKYFTEYTFLNINKPEDLEKASKQIAYDG